MTSLQLFVKFFKDYERLTKTFNKNELQIILTHFQATLLSELFQWMVDKEGEYYDGDEDIESTSSLKQLRSLAHQVSLLSQLKIIKDATEKQSSSSTILLQFFTGLKTLIFQNIPFSKVFHLNTVLPSIIHLSLNNCKIKCLKEILSEDKNDTTSELIDFEKDEDETKEYYLEVLNLRGNLIRDIDPSITRLTNLKYLDLSNNRINHINPSLKYLNNLKVLDLSYNNITCFYPLSNLPSITHLSLQFNLLQSIQGVNNLTTLEHLNLSNNLLMSFSSLRPIQTLSSLQQLMLGGNMICSTRTYRQNILNNLHSAAIHNVQVDGLALSKRERKKVLSRHLIHADELLPSIDNSFLASTRQRQQEQSFKTLPPSEFSSINTSASSSSLQRKRKKKKARIVTNFPLCKNDDYGYDDEDITESLLASSLTHHTSPQLKPASPLTLSSHLKATISEVKLMPCQDQHWTRNEDVQVDNCVQLFTKHHAKLYLPLSEICDVNYINADEEEIEDEESDGGDDMTEEDIRNYPSFKVSNFDGSFYKAKPPSPCTLIVKEECLLVRGEGKRERFDLKTLAKLQKNSKKEELKVWFGMLKKRTIEADKETIKQLVELFSPFLSSTSSKTQLECLRCGDVWLKEGVEMMTLDSTQQLHFRTKLLIAQKPKRSICNKCGSDLVVERNANDHKSTKQPLKNSRFSASQLSALFPAKTSHIQGESLTSSGNYVTSGKDYEILPKKSTR